MVDEDEDIGPNEKRAGLASARQSAAQVFRNPKSVVDYEPRGRGEAAAAVSELSRCFERAGGTVTEMIGNARAGASVLSGDRLQGLSEIVQNADDAHATRVRFVLRDDALEAIHNGRPLSLRDVHALAAPWLTTKREDEAAVGRFGIGLMTLNALSPVLEVYSGDYGVRFGGETLLTAIEGVSPAAGADERSTLLRIPLSDDLSDEDFLEWAANWDDAALLFLGSVREVEFSCALGDRRMHLDWIEQPSIEWERAHETVEVVRREAEAADGRRWTVYSAEVSAPEGLARAHKATASTTPVAVAVGTGEDTGMLYAGLPIVATEVQVRANAQLDPIASRQGFADTPWNHALLYLVASLWAEAVLDCFSRDAAASWGLVPIPTGSPVAAEFDRLVQDHSREVVADQLMIRVGEEEYWIGQLAVEAEELDGLVTASELVEVTGLESALPTHARDPEGQWRVVLEDWRRSGVDLPDPVEIVDVIGLLSDERVEPERLIDLAAVALSAGLSEMVASHRMVLLEDLSRVRPPSSASPSRLVEASSGLAVGLGVGRPIHAAHLQSNDAAERVVAWLRSRRALIDGTDDRAVLSALNAAGLAGQRLSEPLDDTALVALRDALEQLEPDEWHALGPGIGRAITIDCFQHEANGKVREVKASPASAYLWKSIDKDEHCLAFSADTTPGLTWVSNRYGVVLKSTQGRSGLGAQRFLRTLGVETFPRLVSHPKLNKRYQDRRRGLAANVADSPRERQRALVDRNASVTLDDLWSPDLERILKHIAADTKPTRRRERAASMIGTLGRAWASLADSQEVAAAAASYGWQNRGSVWSWWMWQLATIPWLDDSSAVPSSPMALRVKTPATVAVYGSSSPGYLHSSFKSARTDVLMLIGVTGEPTMQDLCNRLVSLRDSGGDEAGKHPEAGVLYHALAERLQVTTTLPGDLPVEKLRQEFARGPGLVLTASGWHPPSEVFRGPPIFGERRRFAPPVRGAERLWTQLQMRLPSIDECVDVLAEMARERGRPTPVDQVIMLESLREVERRVGERPASDSLARRLARLSLWTSKEWVASRPILMVADPSLAAGLGELVPVWSPGGDVAQFQQLAQLLRLTGVPADAGAVVSPDSAERDEEATELFQSALELLHEDLVRNAADSAAAVRVSWSELRRFEVFVASDLSVRVPEVGGVRGAVRVRSRLDIETRRLYLSDPRNLGRIETGGRTIAGLFEADQRSIAQAWLAAMDSARSGLEAAHLMLAAERRDEEEGQRQAEMEKQLRSLQSQASDRRRSAAPAPSAPLVPSGPAPDQQDVPPSPRRLVDPSSLRVVHPEGQIVGSPASRSPVAPTAQPPRTSGGELVEPQTTSSGPVERTSLRGYSDQERETVGLELARKVLSSSSDEMVDLRAQHGVGADSVDQLRQFFELKVYSGVEPDSVKLEPSQIRRAMSTDKFFLVLVSNVESSVVPPKVRVIVDPLRQLQMVETSEVRFSGIRASLSLVFDLDGD